MPRNCRQAAQNWSWSGLTRLIFENPPQRNPGVVENELLLAARTQCSSSTTHPAVKTRRVSFVLSEKTVLVAPKLFIVTKNNWFLLPLCPVSFSIFSWLSKCCVASSNPKSGLEPLFKVCAWFGGLEPQTASRYSRRRSQVTTGKQTDSLKLSIFHTFWGVWTGNRCLKLTPRSTRDRLLDTVLQLVERRETHGKCFVTARTREVVTETFKNENQKIQPSCWCYWTNQLFFSL